MQYIQIQLMQIDIQGVMEVHVMNLITNRRNEANRNGILVKILALVSLYF
jgi:hypothetical protein